MGNLTIQIVNPPADATHWSIEVREGTHQRRIESSELLVLDQPAEFTLPVNWIFPTRFDLRVGHYPNADWVRLYRAQSIYPGWGDYVDITIQRFGDYVFDCALDRFVVEPKRPDRFVVEPKRPVGLWPWLVGGLAAIGLIVAYKKRGKW